MHFVHLQTMLGSVFGRLRGIHPLGLASRLIGLFQVGFLRTPLLVAHMVQEGVVGDSEQPAAESVGFAQTADGPISLDEGLLRDVLCQALIANTVEEVVVNRVQVCPIEPPEGSPITPGRALDERLIPSDLRFRPVVVGAALQFYELCLCSDEMRRLAQETPAREDGLETAQRKVSMGSMGR